MNTILMSLIIMTMTYEMPKLPLRKQCVGTCNQSANNRFPLRKTSTNVCK